MHTTRPAKITSPIVSLSDDYVRLIPISLIVGAVGIALAFFLGGMQKFFFSYLVNFSFLLTICLGSLFFVIVFHLTRAGWSATVRRLFELLAMCVLPMFILFLPILITVILGWDNVYVWNSPGWSVHGDAAAKQAVLDQSPNPIPFEAMKAAFLNRSFFTGRIVAYFLIWGFMAWFFLGNSLKQDETGDKSLSLKMQKNSTWMMILFAATLVFSSFDILMSLEPLWFSTMFPVYFFAGSALGSLSAVILIASLVQRSGRVTDEITVEHYHDLAKLQFSFVFFWGYIAFSQFLLIWYANIPEETFWYDWRINKDGWMTWSIILLVGHLIIPFLGLMARTVRRNKNFLLFASIYMLAMHWVDHYWIIMPQFGDHSYEAVAFGISDIACAIGMVGVFVAVFCAITANKPLVPLKDPRLGEALNFKNH